MPHVSGQLVTLIRISNATVRQGATEILRDVSMVIEPGEIITIVGPNGSGKSTLVRTVIGGVVPTEGDVWRKPGLRIGYVPQTLHIDPTLPMTVRRFLDLPQRVSNSAARLVLHQTGAAGLDHHQVIHLSGGQLQRVLLARALLNTPDLLILDEPTQGLDQPGAASFYQLIEALRGKLGCATLLVSHDLHVVMSASDRVLCINGHICCQGAPSQVASAPEYRAMFGPGTHGTMALYQHQHDHSHEGCDHAG